MNGELKCTVLTYDTILWDNKNTNTEIKITGNLQVDEADYVHIYNYFNKWIGDPQPRPFSPHLLSLNNISPENQSQGPVKLTSGAMILNITKLWYTVDREAYYSIHLTADWTDSEGNGKTSVVDKVIATLNIIN